MVRGAQNPSLLDKSALHLVKTFPARFPEIAHYYFKFYVPSVDDPNEPSIFELSTKKLLARDPQKIVARMLRDIAVDETVSSLRVSANEFGKKVDKFIETAQSSSKALAIYSKCRDESCNFHHIPMLDLHIKSAHGRGALDLIVEALRKLGQTDGAILDSGKSFHYYGLRLMSKPQWRRFMSACLLLGQLADVRYIGHRLLARKAALRLNKAPNKDTEPKIVACLADGRASFTARYQSR